MAALDFDRLSAGWGLQQKEPGRIREKTDAPGPWFGAESIEIECRPGDDNLFNSKTRLRAEINLPHGLTGAATGVRQFVAFTHCPVSGPVLSGEGMMFAQSHSPGSIGGQSMHALCTPDGDYAVRIWSTQSPDKKVGLIYLVDAAGNRIRAENGRAIHVILEVLWGETNATAYTRVHCNGVDCGRLDAANIYTIDPDDDRTVIPASQRGASWKAGQYLTSAGSTKIVRIDGFRMRDTYAQAAAGFPAGSGYSGAGAGDAAGPTLTVTSPAAGAILAEPSAWSATATDPSGVARVEFTANGVTVSDTSSPYGVMIDPAAYPAGSLTLRTRAVDTLGNATTIDRVVTISHPAPPPGGTDDPDLGPAAEAWEFTVGAEDVGPVGDPWGFVIGAGADPGPIGDPWEFVVGAEVVDPPAPPPSLPPVPTPLWRWELVGFGGVGIGDLQVRGRGLVLGRNLPGTATFSLDLDEAAELAETLAVGEVDLRVTYAGAPIFGGPVTGADVSLEPTAGSVTFGAVGIAAMLAARMIPAGRELLATEQARLAWQLVADAQALEDDLGIAAGALPDSIARSKRWDARTDTLRALGELAALEGGFDWTILPQVGVAGAPYRFDVHYPRQGADRGVVLEYGRNVSRATLRIAADPDALVNEAIVVGAQGVEVVATDPASIARYRRRQRVVQLGEADDATVLGARARAEVGRDATPSAYPRLVLTPGSPNSTLADIGIGDVVRVILRRGWLAIDRPARVAAIDVRITEEGAEALTVTTEAP